MKPNGIMSLHNLNDDLFLVVCDEWWKLSKLSQKERIIMKEICHKEWEK